MFAMGPTFFLEKASPASGIAAFFNSGEAGGYYNFNDLLTIYQDIAATMPCTTVGQNIRNINDLSPNADNLVASAGFGNPVLGYDSSLNRYFGKFEPSVISTPALGTALGSSAFSGNPDLTFAFRSIATTSSNNFSSPPFFLGNSNADSLTIDWYAAGSQTYLDIQIGNALTRATSSYITANSVFIVTKVGLNVTAYQDGSEILSLTLPNPMTLPAAVKWNMGVLGDLPRYFDGDVYGALLINRVLTSTELAIVNAQL
jgi:hypothetical protein